MDIEMLSPFGEIVWEDRYALKDENGKLIEKNILETFRRVATAIASKEKDHIFWGDEFYEIMSEQLFCPAGRVIAHSGTHYSQLLNCFVLPFQSDSLEEIMNTAKNIAIVQKFGGGCGENFSKLRPSGSYIKGVNGRSSGTIGFISMLSTVSEIIEQGGCFVAETLVATMDGPKKIKNLKKGDLVYSMSENGYVLRPCASNAFLTKKSAEVWKVQTDKNLTIYPTKDHPFMPQTGFDFNKKNYVKVEDLNEGFPLMPFNKNVVEGLNNINGTIISDDENILVKLSEFSHKENVWNIEIEDTHNFVVCNKKMNFGVVVSNTRRGANLGLLEVWHPDIWEFISYKTEHNWECLREFIDVNDFDKWESFKYENLYKWQMFNVSAGITDEFLEAVKDGSEWLLKWEDEEWLLYTVVFKKFLGGNKYKELEFEVTADSDETAIWKVKKKIPYPTSDDIFEVILNRRVKASEIWDRMCYNAWADGCPGIINLTTARKMHNLEYAFPIEATNPCFSGDCELKTVDGYKTFNSLDGKEIDIVTPFNGIQKAKVWKSEIKLVLQLSCENHKSIIVTPNQIFMMSDGEEICAKDCLNKEIKIAGGENVLINSVLRYNLKRIVYDFSVPGKWGIVNGFITHNCGEQALGEYGSCNLSSIILPNFVVIETKSIDFEKLREVVHTAVRFSDNVIDNCVFPIPEIEEKAYKERRIGLGTMGVHDMLIKMGIGYDTDLGRDTVEEVLIFIRDEAYKASIEIAEEKGTFPAFKKRKFLNSGFIKTLPQDIRKLIDQKGIRNGALLSQAPTGCLVKNTLIPTTKGLVQIGRISNVKEKEWEDFKDRKYCVSNDMGRTHIARFFNNGKAVTIKIITSKGYFIEGTFNHKIRVISKGHGYSWKKLEDIKINDKIVLKKDFFIDKTTWLKPEVAKILGYYMANGWWSSSPVRKDSDTMGYRIFFSLDPANKELQKEIKNLILNAWGVTFNILDKNIRIRDTDGFKFEISSVKLHKWFEHYDCIKDGAINAFIPEIILKSSRECLIEFIKGYWMGDGCFQMKKKNISFKTISVRMATELQVALLSIGIPSSVYYDDSAIDKEVFIEGRKIKNIEPNYVISVDRGYTKEILDNFKIEAPFDFVKKTNEVVPVFIDELNKYSLPVISKIDKDDIFVSINAYKKEVPKEKWNWFVANNLMIVFAKDIIISEEEKDTVDLSVAERSHTYIANGFVTHNSISALNNISSGCEPWYSLVFQRNTRLGSYEDGCPTYIEWRKKNPDSPIPPYFKTAPEISPEDHVKMLILFSKYIDSSVSKTINLPNSATVGIIKDTFIYAMENGVKGLTVFRDGSKEGVLVKKDKKTWENVKKAEQVIEKVKLQKEVKIKKIDEVIPVMEEEDRFENVMSPKKRGDKTVGATYRVHMHNHNLYVTVNRNKEGELVEIFATVGESKKLNVHHTSGVEDSWAEGLGKMISLALRAGVKPSSIIRNLKNIPSDKPVFATIGDNENSEHVPSPPHAIARVIEEELLEGEESDNSNGGHCKECGSTNLRPKSPTCDECIDCGFSGCG